MVAIQLPETEARRKEFAMKKKNAITLFKSLK